MNWGGVQPPTPDNSNPDSHLINFVCFYAICNERSELNHDGKHQSIGTIFNK